MKIYFAHSFSDGPTVRPLRESGDMPIRELIDALTQLGVVVVDPADAFAALGGSDDRFTFCLRQIAESNAVVVDARSRLGLGVGAELMFAHQRGIRVFAVLPPRSYYRRRRDDGTTSVHAFLNGLATDLCPSFEDCLSELRELEAQEGKNA
jgi:hypothetical protein